MQITVNGEAKTVRDDLTVRDLIVELGLTDGPVAVELNREVVPRAQHATTRIAEGNALEIVHLVGGG